VTQPEVILVTPEMRGRIIEMWRSQPMEALIRSMRLRHELLMRQIVQECATAAHGIAQAGIQGIPPTTGGPFRTAALLLLAIEAIEREATGEQIILKLV